MNIVVKEVVKDLYVLRVDDDRTRHFEALWAIPEGVTYNAYLLAGDDKFVLFDSWKRAYADAFLESLGSIADPRDIDYIVVHHMEQDHTGSIPRVLEANGGRAEVLGHPLAGKMLRRFYGISPKFRAVKDGEELPVAQKTLKFVYTPWLHWPETIMTFIPEQGVLISGDAFGGFSIPPGVFDDDPVATSGYLRHVRKYIVTVVGHYSGHVLKAIDKLRGQGISPRVVAPAHGLVFRSKPEVILDYYARVARGVPERGKVAVIYCSMYGFVAKAIAAAVDELRSMGANPVVYGFTDSEHPNIGDAISEIADAEGVVIGAPTYEGGVFPLMRYILDMITEKVRTAKPALVVSSYGWSGAAGREIAKRLEEAGFNVVGVVEFSGYPGSEDLKRVKNAVRALLGRLER